MEFSHEHDDETAQSSLFSLSCESGKFSPYVHPEEANTVIFPCQGNKRRNTVTCKDEHIEDDIEEVNTLNMGTVRLKGACVPIEEGLPVIPKHFFNFPSYFISNNIVGVSLKDIFVSKPISLRDEQYRVSQNLKINTELLQRPVFRGKKVILIFDERDILLEYLWWDRDKLDLFDKLSQIGFHAITTPNFSLFKGECPVGHALNIKKGLVFGEELEKRGVLVIPHVYSVHEKQAERWCEWLKGNPTVKTIAMNCQLQRKSEKGRKIAIVALEYILSNSNVNIILNGADRQILNQLKKFKRRLHLASSGIFKKMEMFKIGSFQDNFISVTGHIYSSQKISP